MISELLNKCQYVQYEEEELKQIPITGHHKIIKPFINKFQQRKVRKSLNFYNEQLRHFKIVIRNII